MKNVIQDTTLDPRLAGVVLRNGAGETLDRGMCAMQAVAWLGGEIDRRGHLTDAPKCACRVVRRFVISCNDRFGEADRQKLLAIVPALVGSRASEEIERKRAYSFADFAVRTLLPWLCDKLGRAAEGARLRALGKVTDRATAELARQEARSVCDILRAAAAAYAAAAYAADAAAAAADAAADAAAYAAAAAARSEVADLCVSAIKTALEIVE